MNVLDREEIRQRHNRSLSLLSLSAQDLVLTALLSAPDQKELHETISGLSPNCGIPPFLSDLMLIESAIAAIPSGDKQVCIDAQSPRPNPTLQLLNASYQGLASFFADSTVQVVEPRKGQEYLFVYQHPLNRDVVVRPATSEDLLMLKMVVEDIRPEEIARIGSLPVENVYAGLDRAADKGYLIAGTTLIQRDPRIFGDRGSRFGGFLQSSFMTLQWHVTQSCDLHCKHCYDRSDRSSMKLEDGIRILDDFSNFCRERRVQGQISFSGGNPLLYPHFMDLYRAAAERGFVTAVLGNPSTREQIEALIDIQMPSFFQVSLEGLQKHNDKIRGTGHFKRVIAFLSILHELGIYSMVMLTLTKDNVDQVIPLAAVLRDKTDTFNFNRLAMVGEGSNLRLPSKERYTAFLKDYLNAADENPVIGIKDNLFNILLEENESEVFGGCTGFGCGAAFNFVSILPDGEAHACRKFPSPIGNILEQGIAAVYDSDAAKRYRDGCSACSGCSIRPVCGGCLAVAYGHGLDVFTEKDPCCYICPKS